LEQITLERLSLRKNFIWSFSGNMLYSCCLWMMLMAMTKLLQAEKVGMFILATAIVTPVQYLSNMYLGGVMASDAKNEHKFGECFALRILTVAFMAISVIIISIFLGKGVEMTLITVAVVLYKSADCYADITYGLLQKYERLDKVALSKVLRGAAGALIFVALIFTTKKPAFAFAGVAAVWGIIFVLFDLSSVRRFEKTKPIFDTQRLKELAVLSAPLGITMAIASFNVAIPRYFTEKYLGSAQLGYFGSLAYIIALFRIAISAMSVSALPRLAKYYVENVRSYLKLLAKMVAVAALIGLSGVILGLLLGSRFIAIIYTADYAKYKTLFLWLLIAGGVQYVSAMLCNGLTSARLFKVQVPLFAAVSLVTVMFSWMLIPRFGVIGAAWAMLLSSLAGGIGALAIIIWNIAFRRKHIGAKSE
jgi:O-antigen/teichoic acid export membrane protein